MGRGAWCSGQWLKLPTWKVGDSWFEPRFVSQDFKKQNGSFLRTRKDSTLRGASATEW